jgi:hypothetical protein
MYNNLITIRVKDLNPELSGTIKFRKPKASEMIELSEEQIKLQDENSRREAEGLKPKEVSSGMVKIIEKLVCDCYIWGQNGEEEISKETFELNFLDIVSVMNIFSKLSDTEGLGIEKVG